MAAPALLLAACASQPLEERYTTAELRKMYEVPAACREEYSLGGWRRDGEKCGRDGGAERARVREALARRHAADLAAAPACVNELRAPRRFVEELGVNPDRPDAMAEIITRGAVIASSTGRCAADLCAWRSKFEPDKESPYCAMAKSR